MCIRGRSPFEPESQEQLSEDMVAYCRFYGLDLWVEHPEVSYRQGYVMADRHQVMVHYFRLPDQCKPRGTVFILHGYFDPSLIHISDLTRPH